MVVGFERVHDFGQFALELNVDHGTHDLGHAADFVAHFSIHGAALFHFAGSGGGPDLAARYFFNRINPIGTSVRIGYGKRHMPRFSPQQQPNEVGQSGNPFPPRHVTPHRRSYKPSTGVLTVSCGFRVAPKAPPRPK